MTFFTRTVVMAYFDDLYICYEEETEVVLAIAVLGEGGNAYSTNEFSAAVDENDYPDRYYQGLELESGRTFSDTPFDGLSKYRLYIGIYDYTVEKEGQFDQMINHSCDVVANTPSVVWKYTGGRCVLCQKEYGKKKNGAACGRACFYWPCPRVLLSGGLWGWPGSCRPPSAAVLSVLPP